VTELDPPDQPEPTDAVDQIDLAALRTAVGRRDDDAVDRARERLDTLVKPLGALGRLEDVGAWLAGAQGTCPPRPLDDVRLVVLAGDHGVAARGVSAYPPEVTAAMVRTFVSGEAGVSVLARLHGVHVRVLDLGVDSDDLPAEVTRFKVRRSSGSIDREDALSDDEVRAAFAVGTRVADEEVDSGADLLVAGDMGIGNSTIAAALVGGSLGLGALEVVGTGTGIDDTAWSHKVAALRDALYRAGAHRPKSVRLAPLDLLRTERSADTAAMTGFLVQAAVRRTPVLLDGLVSCACALLAHRVAEDAADWWLAGHRSTEPAQHRALEALGLEPLVDLGMRLGEGSGALVALPLLRAAQALLAEMGTLADLGLAAEPEPVPHLDDEAT
jgi:nicotinate-nucleotide--dimethylbenzimidazole phosphoribosyltransferase